MTLEARNAATVSRYYEAVQRGAVDDQLGALYDAAVIQEKYPNRLLPNGARRDPAALKKVAARGRGVRNSDCFDPW